MTGRQPSFLTAFFLCVTLLAVSAPSLAADSSAGRNASSGAPSGEPSLEPAISVSNADNFDVYRLALPFGQVADVEVFLASLGDPLDEYVVVLRRTSDSKRVLALVTDAHGVVSFKGIPPGDYRVEANRRVKEDGEISNVYVGDIRVKLSEDR